MHKPSLTVISPVESQHANDILDLGAKTFAGFGGFFAMRKNMREWYLLNSHYDWKASAIGLIDGQLTTHFGIWGYPMRIGKGVVRCGGVGMVSTHGEFHKQGLMAQTVPHSVEHMRQEGYDLSILFGIWDFYHRFGYVQAWAENTWFTWCDRVPKDLPKVNYESFTPEPREDIAKLHNRYTAELTGAAVRPTFSKKFFFLGQRIEGYLWKEKNKLAGHVIVSAEGPYLACWEATGKPDQILTVLKAIAETKQLKELRFDTLPYLSPLAKRLRQLTCRMERQYVKSGSAMVRVINLKSCLEKMVPELSSRLKESELGDYQGELTITGPESAVGLTLDRGQVRVGAPAKSANQIKGGFEIAQLLIGTDDPMEICEGGKMRLAGDAARLVRVLFPNEYPQLQNADRY